MMIYHESELAPEVPTRDKWLGVLLACVMGATGALVAFWGQGGVV